MPHVSEIVMPLSKPQTLKVMFNNTAYKKIKELSGVSVFELQDPKKIQDPELLNAVLFAGTRKYHHNVSLELLGEWLDEIDTGDLFKIYVEIMKALCASFLAPDKRTQYLAEMDVTLRPKAKIPAAQIPLPMETGGSGISSTP